MNQPIKIETFLLHLSNERGAIQDKRSFSTSFFVSPLSKTLTALVKTRIGVVNEKVATFPFRSINSNRFPNFLSDKNTNGSGKAGLKTTFRRGLTNPKH
jgi:hypothetical protein